MSWLAHWSITPQIASVEQREGRLGVRRLDSRGSTGQLDSPFPLYLGQNKNIVAFSYHHLNKIG